VELIHVVGHPHGKNGVKDEDDNTGNKPSVLSLFIVIIVRIVAAFGEYDPKFYHVSCRINKNVNEPKDKASFFKAFLP
jgi:hypothetical protein